VKLCDASLACTIRERLYTELDTNLPVYYHYYYNVKADLSCSSRATMPAASGAEADVPE